MKYSVIDMSKNSGEGKVIVKDRAIIDDKFGYGQFTAVKHGNGRDWWLPMPVDIGNKIHISLLTKDTAYLHHSQHIGPAWDRNGGFQASFSPDGSKYVRYNRFHGVFIYDFDRCDGMLSNLVHFPFNDTTQGIYGGCAISPNNRFLYVADFDYLYQFDLWANDILYSKELIGIYDGHISSLWTKFSYIINAPDGRMYIIPPNTTSAIHVINRPNLPGAACDFRQHDIEFPYPYGNTPIFPNFRLGPLDGSPCDTLGLDNHPLADFRPEPTDTSGLAMHFWDVSAYEPAQWLWDFGDGAMSQDTSPVHAYASPGFYTVCLTVSNQYGSDTKCKVVEVKITSGTSNPQGVGEVKVYPNPTSGWIMLPDIDGVPRLIEVLDITGRLVRSVNMSENELDLSELENGLYFLRVTRMDNGAVGSAKVIVSK
ncbi:MAG: PKD domain-containing protein [Saprospiraceae bacterium]|nr:PKD domain-containing protein [Saprospiraceae bacterium]